MENFTPVFKERNEDEYFYFDGNDWIECDEDKIHSLWSNWIMSKNGTKHLQDDGFTVYGNLK